MKQQEMDSIILNVHSVVDIITNSSSEIFVVASKETIKAIKDVVNSILKSVSAELTADDLFEFSLKKDIPWLDYGCELDEIDDLPYNIRVLVKAKSNTLVDTAKILSNLTDLFNIYEASSN